MKRTIFLSQAVPLLVVIMAFFCTSGRLHAETPAKLILQITVDGLRGDLPFRYKDRYGAGGFLYLMENGLVFTNAHYQYANNETIVGHTTLATGAHPADHGMVGNLWLDQASGVLAYNIEDPDYSIVG